MTKAEKVKQIKAWHKEGRLHILKHGCFSVPSEAFVLGITPRLVAQVLKGVNDANSNRGEKRFKGMSPSEHVAIAIWCEADVLERAKEKGIECSREQAQDILDQMDRRQDCSLGIAWDTIDCYLWDLDPEF